MMERWARSVVRHAWRWIAAWVVAAAVIWGPAPRIPNLLEDDATGFLPAEMPSQRAWARLKAEFPDSAAGSRAAVVFAREGGLTPEDERYVNSVARALTDQSATWHWRVRAVEVSPHLQPILESRDGCAAVIAVDLPAEMLTHSSVRRVREIKRELAARATPGGLQVEVSGNAAIGELLDANAKRDVDRTTLWAVGAVTVILALTYRSLLATLLPLVTIGAALLVSLGTIGWAASWGWPINGLVEMFVIVLVVGAGVDYCLFVFSRFREEWAAGEGAARAVVESSTAHAGPAILASAGTNALGLATLALARNRDLYTSGVTIAFSLAIAALAVLSLTPALMRVAGGRLISLRASHRVVGQRDSAIWRWAGWAATRFPVVVIVVVSAVLVPAAVLGWRTPFLYDSYAEFPPESGFVRGARLYQKHFFGGQGVSEMTLVLTTPHDLREPAALEALRKGMDGVAAGLRSEVPVVYQRDLQDPLGQVRTEESGSASALTRLLVGPLAQRLAFDAYIGQSGRSTRIDLGVRVEPRSVAAMALVERIRASVERLLEGFAGGQVGVEVAGEAATYADMRALRTRDFRVIAAAACGLIFLILVALVRSPTQAAILVAATFVTYLSTLGATRMIVGAVWGLPGLSWQIDFLLFVIIMSLGQDYNIFVVARIHEEMRSRPPREAIEAAIRRTGGVVSSCGIIMAATFASMFSGSLLVLKEFAIALPLGILVDTFLVRPLLVPAVLLLLVGRRGRAVL